MWQALLSLLGGEKPGAQSDQAAQAQTAQSQTGWTQNLLDSMSGKLGNTDMGKDPSVLGGSGSNMKDSFMQTDAFGALLGQLMGQQNQNQSNRRQQMMQALQYQDPFQGMLGM